MGAQWVGGPRTALHRSTAGLVGVPEGERRGRRVEGEEKGGEGEGEGRRVVGEDRSEVRGQRERGG